MQGDEKLLTVIHNHIWGMSPLPSEKDLNLYLNHEIKYGIITNEMGVFTIRNNNKKKLSEDDMNDLLDDLADMDDLIIEKFENNKKIIYDSNNDNHKYLLNEYLKSNFEYWVNEYESLLSNYNMKVKFINAKEINNI